MKTTALGWIGWLGVAICGLPYVALLLYLRGSMHADADAATLPGPWFLALLFVVGGGTAGLGLAALLRRLAQERRVFQLGLLLQTYALSIAIFASWYAVLQSSAIEPAFSGIPALWGTAATLEEHVRRLHEVFFDAVYLSIVTITTVGYGDIHPVSVAAKLLTAIEGLLGVGFLGVALGHYFRCVPGSR